METLVTCFEKIYTNMQKKYYAVLRSVNRINFQ